MCVIGTVYSNPSAKLKLFTVRNSICGKVMFSQACVIPSVHGGREFCQGGLHPGESASGRVCIQGRSVFRGSARGNLHPVGYYGVQSTSGQYASYWNAFLCILVFFQNSHSWYYCHFCAASNENKLEIAVNQMNLNTNKDLSRVYWIKSNVSIIYF